MATISEQASVRSPWVWRLWLVACLVFFWFGIQQLPKRGIYFSGALVCGIMAARRKP